MGGLSAANQPFLLIKVSDCPYGWLKERTSCYLLNQAGMTWPEAQASCNSQGAYLASIEDEQEKDLAVSLQAAHSISYLFLGGSWDGETWHWDSGEPFVYTAWRSDEPNGQPYMVSTASGWGDVYYFNAFPSLCEK
ncbi:ladderlectin-like isoform X1 [Mya arenaria]|uniref:ladderlectin-like isoform X1 n=1 Tax=Mya arenaria TaxID=6604 RepID=UPI0022E874CA|nr:ladderlectin-like isoform X1 [Mya arenaria]